MKVSFQFLARLNKHKVFIRILCKTPVVSKCRHREGLIEHRGVEEWGI